MDNDNNDKLRSKKEYYFRKYFDQASLIKEKTERIEELIKTKKEIVESQTYLKAITYDSMPHSPNANTDGILNNLIRLEDKINNIDNKIKKEMAQLDKDLEIFDKIDDMRQSFTENQGKVFEYVYRDKLRRIEVVYHLGITERAYQYIKKKIIKKADFIQED